MKKIEIDSVDLLDSLLSKKEGFIIVADRAIGNKIHHISCSLVQKSHYIKKVVENHKKVIRFIWVDSAEQATEDLKSDLCMNCIAPLSDFLF